MSMPYKLVYDLVRQVPAGCVTTYGTLAFATGNPRRSRVIGTAMARCDDNTVPCHRVVRKDGSMSSVFGLMGPDYQRMLLKAEGVPFLPDGRVDLTKCLYIFEE